jgi:hypothetical protein
MIILVELIAHRCSSHCATGVGAQLWKLKLDLKPPISHKSLIRILTEDKKRKQALIKKWLGLDTRVLVTNTEGVCCHLLAYSKPGLWSI